MAGENPQTTLPPVPREPIISSNGRMSNQWERWIQQLQRVLSFAGGLAWGIINKAESKLSDLAERTHAMLTDILGWTTGADTVQNKHISNANGKVWQDHVEIINANPHGTDHDMLDGLADDDHAQYLLLAGRTGQRAVTPLILGTATDNTTFEADGTMKYAGAATVWNDINTPLLSLRGGASIPDEWQIPGTNLYVSSFNGTGPIQEVHGSLELLHDYKEGTDIIPHVHWCPTTTAAGDVKWFLEYSWQNGGSTLTTSTTISVTLAANGVVGHEERTSFPTITGTGKLIGSRFVYRLYRDPADAADTYADDAGGFDFGIHYETDTTGSRNTTTK